MSHTRDHIIISALVATGQFKAADAAKMEEIGEKPNNPCSAKDAKCIAKIVEKTLRLPGD